MVRLVAVLVVSLIGFTAFAGDKAAKKARKKASTPQIGHMVFFKLKESTPEARKKLVAACDKYLDEHEGTVYYSAGTIAAGFDREVNDRDWDVALHLVFESKAAHDTYQDHPRHKQFIEENKAAWAKVRVFDSEVEAPAKAKKKDKKKAAEAKPAGEKK